VTTAESSTCSTATSPEPARASSHGLEYRRECVVPSAVRDEDKDGTDEVFVRARFVDGDCNSRIQNTNMVKGNF
jgi:hypothetical protein